MNATLESFYRLFTKTFNLFELKKICAGHKVEILSRDCNQTSCIVKYYGVRYYLGSDGSIERL